MLAGPRRTPRSAKTAGAALSLLACLGVLAPLPACCQPDAVGLAAVGVDPRAALRADLDARDALNRPVTREAVERELGGAAAACDPGAAVSALPQARELWRLLDRIVTGLALRAGAVPAAPADHSGLPWLPKPVAFALLVWLVTALSPGRPLAARAAAGAAPTRPGSPLVLRC